ncbi:MAG: GNAT family N-acetyltransferase [Aquabacterium sp.]
MSPAIVSLRRAGPDDVPALAQLYADCARRMGPKVYSIAQTEAWVRFAQDPAFTDYILGADTLVANSEGDGAVVDGFCGVDAGGEIRSLYVRVERMRSGLGRALLGHALAHGQAQGLRRFGAWATPFSRPIFEAVGMPLVRCVTEPFQGVGFERYRMEGTPDVG